MLSFSEYSIIHKGIRYHLDTGIPLSENIFRIGSKTYLQLFEEARKLPRDKFDSISQEILNSDIGKYLSLIHI